MKQRSTATRRALLRIGPAAGLLVCGPLQTMAAASSPGARVCPEYRLEFPRDHGAHPDFRIEWWYVTGWLSAEDRPLGFQITFFRVRTAHANGNPSRFAPYQLLLAHAAIADPELGRLRHAQQAWRVGPGTRLNEDDTGIAVRQWSLSRTLDDRYQTRMSESDFGFDLMLRAQHHPVLQGAAGYSRKGPGPDEASHYYSRPGLRADGHVRIGNRSRAVRGQAWLDHEWSQQLLPAGAVGWDWMGITLDDGSSLTVFRLRDANGNSMHAYARLLRADGSMLDAAPQFAMMRFWRSPRTGVRYPVEWTLRLDTHQWRIAPLMDDQELDATASVGTIYWEGAVRLQGSGASGLGYLELTGYDQPLRL